MGFGSWLLRQLDAIPVVGHVKGLVHLAMGDKEHGRKVMIMATRGGAVIVGCAGGFWAGPMGMAAGATAGGFLMDAVASLTTNEKYGVIKGVDFILQDVQKGGVPIKGLLYTAGCISSDALWGFAVGTALPVYQEVAGLVGEGSVAASFDSIAVESMKILARDDFDVYIRFCYAVFGGGGCEFVKLYIDKRERETEEKPLPEPYCA